MSVCLCVCLGDIQVLKLLILDISEQSAILSVESMRYQDERVLLGYVLHYIATPYKNVTFYDGRDGCGADG